jgi:hypothetical protein
LGVTSIVLIILQPLAVGAWCTLCLVTAAAMLIMIAPAADEVIATCQFLIASRREGQPFWRTFFKGGTLIQVTVPPQTHPRRSVLTDLIQASGLDNVPWTLGVSTVLGIWLMFVPAVLQTSGAAADNDHLVGALVVTFAVIAWGQIARIVRWINVILGAWIVVAPWLLAGGAEWWRWNHLAVGVALVLLSIPRGRVQERFGSWDRFVF